MQKQKVNLPAITLAGLTVRTNNKNEMNPEASRIGSLVGLYFGNQVANRIQHRANPGVTYSVYTEYDSDEFGDYTCFIGEAVDSIQEQDVSQFTILTLPESHYQKFTTLSGKMPDVVISAWQKIWSMNKNDLGGTRQYKADFELYDEKAADPSHAVVDIYIGINP